MQFIEMSMDERWVNRTAQVMFDTFHWFHGEAFSCILDDLLNLPADRKVIAEGFRLLPLLVEPLLASPGNALWLLSSPEFRRKAFTERGSLWSIPNKTSNPEKALQNQLEREVLFEKHLSRQIESTGLRSIRVDGVLSEDELYAAVSRQFELEFEDA
ncbi:hypothetical protein [Pelagicoccus mobilis]